MELNMKRDATYLVVEVRSAYVVVLDNSGRFIKAANSGYEVGDITDKIIPLIYPQDRKKRRSTIIRMAASIAACVCLGIFGLYEYQYMYVSYGSIHMQINPEVEISLSRSGRVLDIEGENKDGRDLIEGYSYEGKDKETVVDELADLAIERKYLEEGGQIAIDVDASSGSWAEETEAELLEELTRYLQGQDMTIEVILGSVAPEADDMQEQDGVSAGEEALLQKSLEELRAIKIPVPSLKDQADGSVSGNETVEDDGITDYSEPSGSSSAPASSGSGSSSGSSSPSRPSGSSRPSGLSGSSGASAPVPSGSSGTSGSSGSSGAGGSSSTSGSSGSSGSSGPSEPTVTPPSEPSVPTTPSGDSGYGGGSSSGSSDGNSSYNDSAYGNADDDTDDDDSDDDG